MEFPSDIEHLNEMLTYLRAELLKSGLDKQQQRDVELCGEEALVNVIMHGHAEKKPLQIECEGNGKEFTVTIVDHGVPFNPTIVEIDPRVDRPIDERKVGGLGLYLIRKLTSEISYKREGEANILSMVFRF